MSSTITAIGMQGLYNGLESAVRSAELITTAAASGELSVEGFLSLQQSERQVAAAGVVLSVGRELDDAILDIMA